MLDSTSEIQSFQSGRKSRCTAWFKKRQTSKSCLLISLRWDSVQSKEDELHTELDAKYQVHFINGARPLHVLRKCLKTQSLFSIETIQTCYI